MITMYDSTNVEAIPLDAKAVAGYVDGRFANYNALVVRFPHAYHLSIAVFASHDADCLDIENGDASPSDAPAWVRRQHGHGQSRPVVYANASTMPSVIAALTADDIQRHEYRVWTAHYTQKAHIEPGSDATQYYNDEATDIDISLCLDTFFVVSPPNPPANRWQPDDEKRWCSEWDALKGRNGAWAKVRRLALRGRMVQREKKIAALARREGWNIENRGWRYTQLELRTHG
jgi:hypothetical protein